jgi:UDP-2,4-diacetamido-2,4,6-trideoxy-beta-L-altropyranose hydrolase
MRAVFITEGTKNIGFGHITRCLAIAQAFEEKKIETFLIINGDKSILQLLKKENYKIIDWIKSEGKLFNLIKKDDIVFIDSYLANKNFYEKINKLVKQAVYIDDNNRLSYPKGIIINGNIHAASLPYPKKKGLTYLLGPKYAPIRKEFWNFSFKNINKKVKNVLITFGGDDKRNLTPKALFLLQKNYPNINYKVIIGNGFKNKSKIKKLITNKIELVTDPNPEQIRNLMINCDIAISASGQTTLELLRLRIPTIIIVVADNQENIAKILTKKLLVEYAGNWKEKSLLNKLNKKVKKLYNYEVRKSMFDFQKNIVDGHGARRIVKFIIKKKPVKILFLSNNEITFDLAIWLRDVQKENVIIYGKELTRETIKKMKPDFLVSYNYKYIIKGEILNLFSKGKAMNLHISYLPWNKGSNPNFWSFIDNTIKGVTIHVLDKGVDTGDILIQKKIDFKIKKETLSTTYLKLNRLIKKLFKDNWLEIKNLKIKLKKQHKGGSVHTLKEFDKIKHLIEKDRWKSPIFKLQINKNESDKNS